MTNAVINSAETAAAALEPRPIWLCADDYGISPAVSRGIRDLVQRGRINATSVMMAAPSLDQAEIESLLMLNAAGRRVAIGLHVTLTAPFRPISRSFQAEREGSFPQLDQMFVRGAARLIRRDALVDEIANQLDAFVAMFGREPDFVDGHQHVHLFPQVREALLQVVGRSVPDVWVRQCGRVGPLGGRLADPKGVVLDMLSSAFRTRAAAHGVVTNPAFAGTYDFASKTVPDYAKLFGAFLRHLPPHSVVMCHPGFVDAELERLDPLTTLREHEHAFLSSEAFPALLAAHRLTLA